MLEDRSTLGGTSKITLFFDGKVETLTRWRIVDPQGFLTTVTLSNVDRARRVDAEALRDQLRAHAGRRAPAAEPGAASPSRSARLVRLAVTTWNINSVRLRIEHVRRFLAEARPDVLCLQETKCPDDRFPAEALRSVEYPYLAYTGQKGYNGVAILSRLPFGDRTAIGVCGRGDARHIAVTLAPEAGGAAGIAIHNFYVPAGGDIPDPALNPKFAHKLDFLAAMRAWGDRSPPGREPEHPRRRPQRRAARARRLVATGSSSTW